MDDVIRIEATGRPARPTEVAFAVVVTAYCLVFNAFAVIYLQPLSTRTLGQPLAVAYHSVERPLVLVPIFLLVLCLLLRLSAARGARRTALIAFIGAACANVISASLWSAGVPDYIVLRDVDLVANLSDVIMTVSAATLLASMIVDLVRGRRNVA